MIRVILFLLAVAVLAAGFAWVADRPGDVVITWMGYHIETSVMVAALAVAALVLVLMLLWAIVRFILRSPEQVSLFFRHRRAMKGYLAISRGLIAIGAGDLRSARKSANDAARLSPGDPLALLLTAQSAQMAGDRDGAERAFREMTKRDDTKLLGLRGLYIEAQRRDDAQAARLAAEEAAQGAAFARLGRTGRARLSLRRRRLGRRARCARSHEERAGEGRLSPQARRAADRPRVGAGGDSTATHRARRCWRRSKLAPDLVPAAALAGRRLAEAGEQRKARKILEKAWTINPHPDIAEAYANLRLGDSARERLARMQKLAANVPGQLEGALAVARAALDAREFAGARAALAPYLSAPTRRVATLMAEIEESEHGDEGRVREWMGRAMRAAGDPVWTADGVVSERWLPVSPNGRLDGFTWKLPLAEIGVTRPVIEAAPPPPAAAPIAVAPPVQSRAATAAPQVGEIRRQTGGQAKPVEPVIPLVHAPDDPGPDSALESDPVPEPTSPAAAGRLAALSCSCFVRRPASGGRIAIPDPRRYEWPASAGVAQR